MQMRTALCLSGHLRSFAHTFRSIKRYVIDPLSCDVFLATWEHAEQSSRAPVDRDLVLGLYRPLGYTFESRRDVKFTNEPPPTAAKHLRAIQPMWYLISRANDLKTAHEKETGCRYDAVIRSRFDLDFFAPVDMGKVAPKTYHVARFGMHPRRRPNDMFGYGTSETMDVVSTLFSYVSRHARKKGGPPNMLPEELLRWWLDHCRLGLAFSAARFAVNRFPRGLSVQERRYFRVK
jgi:hypothetical protein